MGKKLYHITAVENIDSILSEGLKVNEEGMIFLFENKSILNTITNEYARIADLIAYGQIFLKKYAMFEIDAEGIDDLENDNVAELSAGNQWITRQNIPTTKISPFGIFKVPNRLWKKMK